MNRNLIVRNGNYFEEKAFFPWRKKVYFIDYIDSDGTSQMSKILDRKGVKARVKQIMQYPSDNLFFVGITFPAKSIKDFEESVETLVSQAPLYCETYSVVLNDITSLVRSHWLPPKGGFFLLKLRL